MIWSYASAKINGVKYGFNKIRFALFTRSYAGYSLSDKIRRSKTPNLLIKKLAKVLLLDKKLLRCFILHKTCQRELLRTMVKIGNSDEKAKVYVLIEKELIFLIQEKTDRNSLISEDYEYALLEPAIERVAGNNLSEITDDGEFELKMDDLVKTYRRFYYDIACKYRLPTLRIVSFILRLITL